MKRLPLPHVDPLLRLPAVLDRTGHSRSGLYRDIKAGKFPAPIRHGRTCRWLESTVQTWINDLHAKRAAAAEPVNFARYPMEVK